MATPQVPDGQCIHCHAPVIDLFLEWTDEYQTAEGKHAILAGEVVLDCYYCREPLQLILPLAIIQPRKRPNEYRVAKRSKGRCEEWLRSQHPHHSLSQIVEAAGWQHEGVWAFDGYNWKEGEIHHHGQDMPPCSVRGEKMQLTPEETLFLTALTREQNQTGCKGPAHALLRQHVYPEVPQEGPGSIAFSYETVPLTHQLLKEFKDLQAIDDFLHKGELIAGPPWPWPSAEVFRARLEEARRELAEQRAETQRELSATGKGLSQVQL